MAAELPIGISTGERPLDATPRGVAPPLPGGHLASESGARFVQKQNRRSSRNCAVIIVEHSIETLAPMHRLRWCDDRGVPQELVCEALMIALGVVVRHEVGDRMLKGGLSEADHSVQTLGMI